MNSGFWAGAVPPWAYIVGALGCFAFLLVGMWVGYGRGQSDTEKSLDAEDAEIEAAWAEETRLAREQAKARRTHPVYRQPDLTYELRQEIGKWDAHFAHEARLASEDQALAIANEAFRQRFDAYPEQVFTPAAMKAITTGEIQAITDETDIMVARWKADNDLWLAEHGLSDG